MNFILILNKMIIIPYSCTIRFCKKLVLEINVLFEFVMRTKGFDKYTFYLNWSNWLWYNIKWAVYQPPSWNVQKPCLVHFYPRLFVGGRCFLYVIYVCLRIVVYNTYCFVFLFVFLRLVDSISGLSISDCPLFIYSLFTNKKSY